LRFPLGRLGRIGIGVGLLALALYVSWPHVVMLVGSEAVVNGRLIVVHSPIEGKVVTDPPPVGAEVASGEVVVVVENDRQNRSFLNELRTEHSTLVERLEALRRQEEELSRTRRELADRSSQFRQTRKAILDRQIEQAEAAVRAQRAVSEERQANLQRRQDLFTTGFASQATLDDAAADARLASERLAEAELAVKRLKEERAAAEQGVFVDTSQNDVPYSRQRSDEIELRQQDLRARRREYEIRAAQIDNQIVIEEERLAVAQRSVQRAPSRSVVWQRSVAKGTDVVVGGELLQLLDCDDLFLEVMLDQRHFDAVRPGQRTSVRLIGSDTPLDGVVRTVRGNATSARDTLAVARPGEQHQRELAVTVAVNPQQLAGVTGTFCSVGRSARVSFDTPLERRLGRALAGPANGRN
jgi:multidrug resistance efflux pump